MNTDKIYAESIASEYSVKNDAKVVALRKLDKKVKDFPLIFSFVLGVISTLVLGTGMSLTMGVIGNETEGSFIEGYILVVIGIIGITVNFPIYKRILTNRKRKYAGDIVRLANEIVKEA